MTKRLHIIALAVGTLGLCLVAGLFAAVGLFTRATPNTASRTTDTTSAAFATEPEKIAFLERYLALPSDVEATEFHVVYQDNSTGLVPGPSDWDIQAVLRVDPTDLDEWITGMQPVAANDVDLAWGYALLPNEPAWAVQSAPVAYQQAGVVVAVFEREGIVFKRATTM